MVDLEFDQLVQMVDQTGQWVCLTVRKADHPTQKGTPARSQVVLDSQRVDWKGIPAGPQVVLVAYKVVLDF